MTGHDAPEPASYWLDTGPHELHGAQGPYADDEAVETSAGESTTSHAAWSALADELIAALTSLDHFIAVRARTVKRNPDQHRGADVAAADDAELQTVFEHLHRGAARAVVQLGQLTQRAQVTVPNVSDCATTETTETTEAKAPWSSARAQSFDHPLIQLVQAYGAAFGAVAAASLSLARTPTEHVPGVARRLVELAVRSAKGLRQAMDLAFGQQGLGTVQHLCDHIATLENQADALYHSAIATSLARRRATGQLARWTAEDAEHVRRLATLEALTDRCEEIAEALLLAEHLL